MMAKAASGPQIQTRREPDFTPSADDPFFTALTITTNLKVCRHYSSGGGNLSSGDMSLREAAQVYPEVS